MAAPPINSTAPTYLDHQERTDAGSTQPWWESGEPPRRLYYFLEHIADTAPSTTALECEGVVRSYAEFDADGNRVAHYLNGLGIAPGDTVGILIDRSLAMYQAILGALKSGATYVPIDPNAPHDRVQYIVEDAQVKVLLTTTDKASSSEGLDVRRMFMDEITAELAQQPAERLHLTDDDDPVAYIIYTSGSTGRPKGVMVAHSSICNFINVAKVIYGVQADDRVYQGMSVSFDFSMEELWTTWATGAALIAGPTDGRKVGPGLADFLDENRITFMHAVPTVLSTMDRTLPRIHTLNLGGEACPQELVERWGSHGRRILNTYGPTECTASCTWAELRPGEPVTIGKALPTYGTTLRDENFNIVPDGETGELCITGVGVAVGYVGRPDLTAEKFVIDEQGRRTYKTGDLGRYDENGNIVYLGRKDAEVKVRGHRVDLGEIEGVLLEKDSVSTAVVNKIDNDAGGELVGYILPSKGVEGTRELATSLHDHARKRLTAYMVPDYIEFVDDIPLMPSGKPDRKALPAPVHPRLIGGADTYSAPETDTENAVTDVWAETLRLPVEQLSAEADLFTDLGGHSLIAATLVSKLRNSGMPGTDDLSIPDLYSHPTVRQLAGFLDSAGAEAQEAPDEAADRVVYGRGRIFAFGLAQLAYLYLIVLVSMLPIGILYSIHGGEPSTLMLVQMMATVPLTYLFTRWVLPLATARLVGRNLKEGSYPLYGSTHLRVWLVQRSLTLSPLPHLTGSPWASRYLRAMGATIGTGCHIGSAQIPLPSMVTLGDNVTIGYETHLRASEIAEGRLHIGRIVIGDTASIGANCALAGPCTVRDRSVMRAQSLLLAGESIPAGEVWAGSPAAKIKQANDPVIDTMMECDQAPRHWTKDLRRKFAFGITFLEFLPMLAMVPVVVIVWFTLLVLEDGAALIATLLTGPLFVVTACGLILWFRRFALLKTPVGIHHLRSELGVEKWFGDKLLEASLGLSNQLYGTLYTPHWLRMLGAHIGKDSEIATIANIDPDLLTLGDGTFVADMASIGSATYSNGHVAFRRTVVEDRAFVGNASYIPSGTRLGNDSLIGVLSTPPVRGVAAGTSWLGNPPIFLPQREKYDEFTEETTFAPPRWKVTLRYIVEFFRITIPPTLLALSTFFTLWVVSWFAQQGMPMIGVVLMTGVVAMVGSLLVTLVVALMKWIIVGRYRARVEPLWGNFVRRTEFMTGIFETTAVPALLSLVAGTPMLGPVLRLFGAKVGKRTLIDTTYLTEFDLVTIGDDVTVGQDVSLQTHLFEDRVMKMGHVVLEDGASISSRAVVLYGATVGEDTSVAPLTLVMKGESLPANTRWAGIPARRNRHAAPAPQADAVSEEVSA
ncbi:Pls/PosA family non-ribosomal peptide synthetase [Nigerium massiliense]|uniref:Pls/PosA family non-ribosomal peptide synthetase n=1 Tax=Nigerium massiliense TaxID=1522317 RepID=UPI000907A517|nr:Pls/PosA family non-ribosomal peptide synthetase [Nigerium massiliense]